MDNFSAGQKIDFEVKAVFGYYLLENYKTDFYAFIYNESDWSPIQTVTIPASSTSLSPTPSVPEFSWLIIILALLGTATFAVVFHYRGKRANTYSKIKRWQKKQGRKS